jgi:branched-chain amino acid transport system ATP-binding protein
LSDRVVLEAEGIDAFYGLSQILFGMSLSIRQGKTMALLGRNGAGKSTTLKAIAGLVPPRAGRVVLAGREVQGKKPHFIARAGIGYVPEDRQIFPEHTVEDNLLIARKNGPNGEEHWTLRRVYDMFPLLEPMRHRYGGRLSGGEQQMLTIARTLMGNPTALLLDEPSEGLAPIVVASIASLIKQLQAMGTTMLLAEQNMHFCLGIADDVTVIDKGHVVYQDSIAGLRANEQIKQRYLAV